MLHVILIYYTVLCKKHQNRRFPHQNQNSRAKNLKDIPKNEKKSRLLISIKHTQSLWLLNLKNFFISPLFCQSVPFPLKYPGLRGISQHNLDRAYLTGQFSLHFDKKIKYSCPQIMIQGLRRELGQDSSLDAKNSNMKLFTAPHIQIFLYVTKKWLSYEYLPD